MGSNTSKEPTVCTDADLQVRDELLRDYPLIMNFIIGTLCKDENTDEKINNFIYRFNKGFYETQSNEDNTRSVAPYNEYIKNLSLDFLSAVCGKQWTSFGYVPFDIKTELNTKRWIGISPISFELKQLLRVMEEMINDDKYIGLAKIIFTLQLVDHKMYIWYGDERSVSYQSVLMNGVNTIIWFLEVLYKVLCTPNKYIINVGAGDFYTITEELQRRLDEEKALNAVAVPGLERQHGVYDEGFNKYGRGEPVLGGGEGDMTTLLIVAVILMLIWFVFKRPLFVGIALVVVGYCYYTEQFAKNEN